MFSYETLQKCWIFQYIKSIYRKLVFKCQKVKEFNANWKCVSDPTIIYLKPINNKVYYIFFYELYISYKFCKLHIWKSMFKLINTSNLEVVIAIRTSYPYRQLPSRLSSGKKQNLNHKTMPLEPEIYILLSPLLAPKRAQEAQMLLCLSGCQCHYALNPPPKKT